MASHVIRLEEVAVLLPNIQPAGLFDSRGAIRDIGEGERIVVVNLLVNLGELPAVGKETKLPWFNTVKPSLPSDRSLFAPRIAPHDQTTRTELHRMTKPHTLLGAVGANRQ